MTANRTWMEKLGFELEDKGTTTPLWVVVDDCGGERPASLAEVVLWTYLTAPAVPVAPTDPVDMVLHCPACGMQHIDAPEDERTETIHHGPDVIDEVVVGWENPPHRSHLCHGCGHIWRPADVPTNGVESVKTKGKADSPKAAPAAPAEPADGWVLMPKRMTQEMRDVTDSEGWTWEDLLAEAGSISQEEYAAIAAAPVAPAEPTHLRRADGTLSGMFINKKVKPAPDEWSDARLRGIASDYFPDAAHWPAAMLCLRHLLMEQSTSNTNVRRILLDVVPGPDGMGFEIYAESNADVERKLTEMGDRIEELQSRLATPGHATRHPQALHLRRRRPRPGSRVRGAGWWPPG